MGVNIKGFTKVQVNNSHSLSLIHLAGHLVIEGDQVCQAGPIFHKPTLAEPDLLVVLHVPHDSPKDELLHNLPQH